MTESTMSSPLTMHWIEVVDDRGGARLEARWSVQATAAAPHSSIHAA